jgi:hypothetical protein
VGRNEDWGICTFSVFDWVTAFASSGYRCDESKFLFMKELRFGRTEPMHCGSLGQGSEIDYITH